MSYIEEKFKGNCIFQQYNPRSHIGQVTKKHLKEKNIKTLQWPVQSPDLNPVENIWGILTEKIYKNRLVYKSKNELKNEILEEWEKIEIKLIKKLIKGLDKRYDNIIENDGRIVFY